MAIVIKWRKGGDYLTKLTEKGRVEWKACQHRAIRFRSVRSARLRMAEAGITRDTWPTGVIAFVRLKPRTKSPG